MKREMESMQEDMGEPGEEPGDMGHSKKHPGFKAVAAKISQKAGVNMERARAILAASSRKASVSAKKANPRLNRVKG